VRDNTAFRVLDDVRRRYFLGNNLPQMMKKGLYNNTSIHKYAGPDGKQWTLPYKATMVWPIRVITQAAQTGQGVFTGNHEIIGYLTVDTMAVNCFHEETDCDVGALLADALFMFFKSVYATSEEAFDDAQETEPIARDAARARS
jgi:hypothetical protein